ncbi:MAG: histone deacetylase [Desulfobacteraceae bacterium]
MSQRVGIIRDERFIEHKTGHLHPEHPSRLQAVHRMLDSGDPGLEGLIDMEAEMATMEQLELVHTPAHIKKILKTAEQEFTSLAPDTPASAKTYLAAWLAVGGCIRGLESMLAGECDVCFALVRPPGHHALPNRVSGFCIFNNLAVTARFARRRYGFKRILVVDWDVHHGHGLNDLFYSEQEVFYFSSHDTLLYPHTGDWDQTGSGEGEGFTVNIPIPRDLTDDDFVHLYREVLGRVLEKYEPDLILAAAGFDAHRDDPVGRSRLTEQAFTDVTRLLLGHLEKTPSTPPLLLALEGGYDPPALARCVREVLVTLLRGEGLGRSKAEAGPRAVELVDRAKEVHRRYRIWTD